MIRWLPKTYFGGDKYFSFLNDLDNKLNNVGINGQFVTTLWAYGMFYDMFQNVPGMDDRTTTDQYCLVMLQKLMFLLKLRLEILLDSG